MCLLSRFLPVITGEGLATISKRSVDAIKAGTEDAYLWDQDLKGFGLKVTPAVGRSTWSSIVWEAGRAAHAGSPSGPHGVLTADEARTRAKQLLGEVAAGRDPAAALDEVRGSKRLGELLTRFLQGPCRGQAEGKYRDRITDWHGSTSFRSFSIGSFATSPAAMLCDCICLLRQALSGKPGGGAAIEVLQLVRKSRPSARRLESVPSCGEIQRKQARAFPQRGRADRLGEALRGCRGQ